MDDGLKEKFYAHPLIESLKEPLDEKSANVLKKLKGKTDLSRLEKWKMLRASNLPSYIPSETFANVLFDVIIYSGTKESEINSVFETSLIADIEKSIKNLTLDPKTEKLGISLRGLFTGLENKADELDTNIAKGRKNVEAWFDSSMDRLSGWYKRWAQKVAFIVGLVIAVAFNVDSIYMAQELWRNPALREATTAYITDYVNEKADANTAMQESDLEAIKGELETIAFPSGWAVGISAEAQLSSFSVLGTWVFWRFWILKFTGWMITAMAAMQGAPFWFDILKRLVNIRSAGANPKEKTAS